MQITLIYIHRYDADRVTPRACHRAPHPLLMHKERTMRNSRLQAILEWAALAITIVCVWVFVPVQA